MHRLNLRAQEAGPFYPPGARLRLCWGTLPPAIEARALLSWFDPQYLKAHGQNIAFKGGRGQTILFSLQGQDLVLRRYLRGGWWGKLAGDKFCALAPSAHRASLEFALLERMQALNLPVPEPIAALEAQSGLCLRNALITRKIAHSQKLAEIMQSRRLSGPELILIGRTLARFFAAQILHTDLNLRNILLTQQGECVVIDFDKCAQLKCLSKAKQEEMLARLLRSFNKEQRLRHIHFKEADFATLKAACLKA